MARFNTTSHRAKPPVATVTHPIATVSQQPDAYTHQGGTGWTRPPKAELFLMTTGALQDGKGDFYESAQQRDHRLHSLVEQVVAEDRPWLVDFATWLRGPGNIRTAAIIIAVDFVHRSLSLGAPEDGLNRQIINAVCQRPDEPGELLACWTALYGRAVPKPVKRGLADAVRRLYNGKSLLKYDTASKGYRFGDVLNLCHVKPREETPDAKDLAERVVITKVETCPRPKKRQFRTKRAAQRHAEAMRQRKPHKPMMRAYACQCTWYHVTQKPQGVRVIGEMDRHVRPPATTTQGAVFQYALDRRHHPDTAETPANNKTLQTHRALMALPVGERRALVHSDAAAELLKSAGFTWEMLAGWLQGPMDKAAWEAIIPSMNIMAQIRNLRNFDEAGVSDEVCQQIIAKLTDREQIVRSRQFPFRYLAAYQHAPSLRWSYPLELAINFSLANVPSLGGRTLILVDRSPSMFPEHGYYTPKSPEEMSRADQAAVFGSALAIRAQNATLVEFGGGPQGSQVIDYSTGTSLLKLIGKFSMISYTDIPAAIRRHYDKHDRVVIITDEQTQAGHVVCHDHHSRSTQYTSLDALVPCDVPVFMWNLAGYTASAMASGSRARFSLGGLTDQAFKMIPLLESGSSGVWPWQQDSQGT